MSDGLLVAKGLRKSYTSGTETLQVLQGLDVTVDDHEAVAIVGESGVGKSTLLHVLGGLDKPDSGELNFRGRALYGGPAATLSDYRNRQVGFVFQFHHLLPEFTALENVEMPFRIGRAAGGFESRCGDLLQRLGLADRLHHHPGELSGGEQQRVAIARALAMEPALILADEPTGNLDPGTGLEVFGLLRELQAERPFALILVSHNERLARGCDRVMRMDAGQLRPLGDRETREYFDGLGARVDSGPML